MHAYYPQVQKDVVQGESKNAEVVFIKSVKVALSVLAVGSCLVLCLNRFVISILAGADFYGGVWLTLSLLVLGGVRLLVDAGLALFISRGEMKSIGWLTLLEIIVTAVVCYFAVLHYGFIGAAITAALVPLCFRGMYAFFVGVNLVSFCRRSLIRELLPLVLIWLSALILIASVISYFEVRLESMLGIEVLLSFLVLSLCCVIYFKRGKV